MKTIAISLFLYFTLLSLSSATDITPDNMTKYDLKVSIRTIDLWWTGGNEIQDRVVYGQYYEVKISSSKFNIMEWKATLSVLDSDRDKTNSESPFVSAELKTDPYKNGSVFCEFSLSPEYLDKVYLTIAEPDPGLADGYLYRFKLKDWVSLSTTTENYENKKAPNHH